MTICVRTYDFRSYSESCAFRSENTQPHAVPRWDSSWIVGNSFIKSHKKVAVTRENPEMHFVDLLDLRHLFVRRSWGCAAFGRHPQTWSCIVVPAILSKLDIALPEELRSSLDGNNNEAS